jgi:hypothetical protein
MTAEKVPRMKLGTWRALVVLAVALSVGASIYEFWAPRIDLADATEQPVGLWLSIPGRPTATYHVLAEKPASNLAAAGIAAGDYYIPHDSFDARWLWVPGQHVPVTAIHNAVAREATIVASGRPIPPTLLGWIVRTGRIVVQLAMLALALIVAWQIPDAPWVRWLCAFLVLAGFSPWQVNPFEYVGWWRITAYIVEASATQAAICAAMMFAVTISAQPFHASRRRIVQLTPLAFVLLELGIIGLLFDGRGAYVVAPLRLVQIVCIAVTVATLTAEAAQARGQERQRLRYFAWTFALGFSGFFVSDAALWIAGNNWGSTFQEWSIPRITLLLIPIGLAYGLLSHRVVSVHYIAGRTLVYGAITSSLIPIYAATEWATTNYFGNRGKSALVVAIAVIITATFKRVRNAVEGFVKNFMFKKQLETENALDKFAKQAPHVSDAAILRQRYVDLVDAHVAPVWSALYARAPAPNQSDGNAGEVYARTAVAGDSAPEKIDQLDPVVVALASEGTAVEYMVLGVCGHAFPMILRGELVGLLAIGPLRDGEILLPSEMKRLADVTQAVAVALEELRLTDLERRLAEAETGRSELQRILIDLARRPQ